jgi:hypothetical protein
VEQLWNNAIATDGSRAQITNPEIRPKQAESVALGCSRLHRKW